MRVEEGIKTEPNVQISPLAESSSEDRKEIDAVPEDTVIAMTRRQIYDEIWKMSVSGLAQKYNLPYTHLMKQIKEAGIPIPPSGYWTKINFNKPVTKPELPEPADELITIYRIVPITRKRKSQTEKNSHKADIEATVAESIELPVSTTEEHSFTVPRPVIDEAWKVTQSLKDMETLAFLGEEERAVVLSGAMQIRLPDENAKMHPTIVAHRKAIMEWKKKRRDQEARGFNRRVMDAPLFLADTVSDEMLSRVLHLIDALIKAMEPLGCSLTSDLMFVINGETVSITVSEAQDQVQHIPTNEENMQLLKYEEDKRRYSWATKPKIRKYDHVYNGRITFSVYTAKSFRDCKSYVVEDRLSDIMIALYESSDILRKEREVREEAERKRKEEERQKEERRNRYNAEVDQTLMLVNFSEDFDIACKIRRYIAAVEASGTPDTQTIKWLEWAKAKANWYDPTIAKDDEIFGKRKHHENAEQKKLEHVGYKWW